MTEVAKIVEVGRMREEKGSPAKYAIGSTIPSFKMTRLVSFPAPSLFQSPTARRSGREVVHQ